MSDDSGDRHLNRELSWLDFNARVLTLAEDERTPLLERAKFLAVFAQNLDEFFMVRVAGLRRRLRERQPAPDGDPLPLKARLEAVAERTADLVTRHAALFTGVVRPGLEAAGVTIAAWSDLDPGEQERMRSHFHDRIFPVLTPLAADPAHLIPYICGLSLNLAAVVHDPQTGDEHVARIRVPDNMPRFVTVSDDLKAVKLLPIEDLIANHLHRLFPGMRVTEQHLFRITRNADLDIDDDRDEDVLEAMERELARRRFGPPVRLEVTAGIPDHVLGPLAAELGVDGHDIQRVPGLLDLSGLWQIHDIDRPDLKDPPFVPATHPRLPDNDTTRSVFDILRDGDILLHHPYHSFTTSVQRFIEQAATDPDVLAIKQTLYRTSGDSPIVDALSTAAEAGKQVVVLVEVKARFDEAANIGWARKLERAGCHVLYGLKGFKTHAKTALVMREESGRIRRYCHIGTGNYHPMTARRYEDLGLLTADPDVGADLTDLFNTLTGYSRQTSYRRLLVAPHGIRDGILRRVELQIAKAQAGEPALIQLKTNSLVDRQVIDALYRASQAGARVDLIVRGMCTLRPGVPGLSERIRVRSILGRFLEHSRILRFGAGEEAEVWIGSADLMARNLDGRVEAMVQVVDSSARDDIDRLIAETMSDEREAFDLNADGSWLRRVSTPATPRTDLHETLLRRWGRA